MESRSISSLSKEAYVGGHTFTSWSSADRTLGSLPWRYVAVGIFRATQWSTAQVVSHYTDGVPEVCLELTDLLLRYG